MIETVDGSALYVHSAEQVNQMCTKSHFFPYRLGCRGPAGGRSIARRAGNGRLLFQQPGLQRGANRRGKLVLCRQPGVDGAIALVNSRQRGGEIGLFTVRISARLWRPWAVRLLPSSSNIQASTCVSMPWVRRYSSITVSLSQPTANSVNAQPTPVRSLPTAQCCSKAPSKAWSARRRAGDRPGC